MEPRDYKGIPLELADFQGMPYEYYAATFAMGSNPNIYHVFVSGVNENGFTNVSAYSFNINEETPKQALSDIGFRLTSRDSIEQMQKAKVNGELNGTVVRVKLS